MAGVATSVVDVVVVARVAREVDADVDAERLLTNFQE
jgi:hypothetical protein